MGVASVYTQRLETKSTPTPATSKQRISYLTTASSSKPQTATIQTPTGVKGQLQLQMDGEELSGSMGMPVDSSTHCRYEFCSEG